MVDSSFSFKWQHGRVHPLAEGNLVLDVADRARSAALAFLRGTNLGWGRNDLVEWLVRDYSDVARALGAGPGRRKTVLPSDRPLQTLAVERTLLTVRARVVEVVAICSGRGAGAEDILVSSLVRAASDGAGGYGFVPINHPDMTLLDRVTSLVVSDFLTRPNDYRHHLVACEACGEVSFDWEEMHLAECADGVGGDVRESGAVARVRRSGTNSVRTGT